ncbi:hypothetical protein B296_00052214 [Ensete ventricosum]|uniref:Uncharacterized protein n=1 Tax=Ensete ventricosum TaxID=4639 RepID=A0A426XSP1_ENSVE|nr:hypothetical protein B296_00052214 [Ensete ventricosum]
MLQWANQYVAAETLVAGKREDHKKSRSDKPQGQPPGTSRRRDRSELPALRPLPILLNSTRTKVFLQVCDKGLLKTPNPIRTKIGGHDKRSTLTPRATEGSHRRVVHQPLAHRRPPKKKRRDPTRSPLPGIGSEVELTPIGTRILPTPDGRSSRCRFPNSGIKANVFVRKIGFKLRVMGLNRVESFYAFLLRFRSEGSPCKGQPGMATTSPFDGAVDHLQRGDRLQPRPPAKGRPPAGAAAPRARPAVASQ